MLHPDLLNDEGKIRHQDFMHAADQWRLQQRVRVAAPRLPLRMQLYLGARLIAWGMQLQANTPPALQLD